MLGSKEEPIEVYCFGTNKFRLKATVVEIFNEKLGKWQWYEYSKTVMPCPVCGRLMKVYYIPGTTWFACCSEECYKKYETRLLADLDDFIAEMKNKILKKNAEYGDFRQYDVSSLRSHLIEEIREWLRSVGTVKEPLELIDVANLCYMIWSKLKGSVVDEPRS